MIEAVAIAAVILLLAAIAIGYWWYKKNRPIHSFVGVDFGAGSIQPKRIRNLFGPFRVKKGDGTKVLFPVPQGFAHPRMDGRGTLFFGDLETGQLLKLTRNGNLFEAVHGIFMEKAFADGRVQQIVASTKASGLTLKHVLIGVAIVGVLVCIVIYQFAQSGGLAGV